jgi:hypothetical protein
MSGHLASRTLSFYHPGGYQAERSFLSDVGRSETPQKWSQERSREPWLDLALQQHSNIFQRN